MTGVSLRENNENVTGGRTKGPGGFSIASFNGGLASFFLFFLTA